MKKILFALPGNELLGDTLASSLSVEKGKAEIRRFPDGETYIQICSDVKDACVLLVCTLHEPDEKLLPLYFMSQTAKALGARCVCLVSPYLAYMRQDKQFHPGEGVTSTYFGKLLSGFADSLVTIDPHLHRRTSLSEIYTIPHRLLHAAEHISAWIKHTIDHPVLIGPDSESSQWVSDIARDADAPFTVLEKVRHGDRDVEVSVPDIDKYRDNTPVIIDDIISTAHTMIEAARHLRQIGMRPPVCIGIHAVFAGNAYQELLDVGVERVVTCNTIPHESNQIDVSSLLVAGINEIL